MFLHTWHSTQVNQEPPILRSLPDSNELMPNPGFDKKQWGHPFFEKKQMIVSSLYFKM